MFRRGVEIVFIDKYYKHAIPGDIVVVRYELPSYGKIIVGPKTNPDLTFVIYHEHEGIIWEMLL